jgi:regulator of protease activity HflC (stomatin/prohibitin superfamily)
MKSAGIGAGLMAAVAVLIWLGTGFFIVQEGQQAVITQFGKYKSPRLVPVSTGACRTRSSAMN